ncbi:MAG: phospho-N-acetylmuramoyl-pentapeptide-transferase [Bacteroidetes bacterium]|nr:MAG: phospho-N-acetylmuramoyl-pentapeptide-transferase [Bacteroidota bacterium]
MLYYLFDYLHKTLHIPGTGVFQYISFRAGMAVILSLLIASIFGKSIIRMLQKHQMGEVIRDLGLQGQTDKKGTPTMGGLMIILGIVVPTLLFAKLHNVYIILLLVSTVWMGFIGFLDDYTKVTKAKTNWLVGDRGIKGKYKVFGQIVLGLIIGLTLHFNQGVTVRKYKDAQTNQYTSTTAVSTEFKDVQSSATTVPFLKNNEFDYQFFGKWGNIDLTWLIYTIIVIFIITAVSNGANLTDGIDGLAAGTSATAALTLAIFAYVAGNVILSKYLNVMYLPNSGEVVIFCAAFVGACIGFLWYNAYPAQVFMGDTGSLMLGGVIAVLALCLRKELLIPVLCGIFLAENLSVLLQVGYFKYTKRKYGEGRRIFLMAPLHHHFQKKGYHEAKIVTRFWTVGIILAILTLVTLKLQ